MPGAGKSAVGRCLADTLGWAFVDLDEAVVGREGADIPTLFAERGESGFRAAEAAALGAVLATEPVVLSCGGGAPCHGDNLERMRAAGPVVWLRASLDTLVERTHAGGRPLLEGDRRARLADLLAAREPCYARADHAIDTDGRPIAAVAADVVRVVRGGVKRGTPG
jgi:shikimate kinase